MADEFEERRRRQERRRGRGKNVAGIAGFALTKGTARALRGKREEGGVVGLNPEDRNAELVVLGSKLGAANARLRARKLFASAERREALDAEHMMRSAEQVREVLGGMKGVLMKLAQMQSFLNDDMPDAWKQALAQLQSDAPPMSGELAASVIEADLGAHPDDLFAEWDPVPIAAASVGQVHRAITHDDIPVAVKVQYPSAADALVADLDNLDMFLRMILSTSGDEDAPSIEDLRPLITEFGERIREEVDYRNEAANQRRFHDYFAGHPFISIPRVVDELSSDTVLTTELVDGVRFAEFETWDQSEKDLAGETIFRFVQHSVFRLGAYNGDPHPGNYLFSPGGRVTFLDFGLVKNVSPEVTAVLGAVFEHGLVGTDPADFTAAMRAAGFLKSDADIEDRIVFEQVAVPWGQIIADEHTTMAFPDTDMKPSSEMTDDEKAMRDAFDLPPDFVILLRLLVGMQAIIARLGATAHWRSIGTQIWPFTCGEPATPLGEEEAAWLAAGRRD